MLSFVEIAVGLALVALVLNDVFQTVIVPRRTGTRFRVAPHITVFLWPAWRRYGLRLHPAWRREDFLGTFAPFLLVLILVVWGLALILGFGMILHALGDQMEPSSPGFGTALYIAATAFLTVGFGDFVPSGVLTRIVTSLAGASGLAIVALVISLTLNLYTSFARREVLVLLLDARAGVPPSGLMLLETFGRYRIVNELAPMFAQYEYWTAEMLDSHLAYAVLPFFRSSHDGQSWISALGAVLDAATLLITAVRDDETGDMAGLRKSRAAAEMMYGLGCHALTDLTHGHLARRLVDPADRQPGIDRSEFETACQKLAEAGYPSRFSDESWRAFAEHRGVYAARLNLLAQYLASPPTQWIGDRSPLSHLHHQEHLAP